MREDLRELLKSAEEDLKLAREIFRLCYYRHACFLAQQAVEKLLKSFLLDKKGTYPFTHDITLLINICKGIDLVFEYLLEIKADKLDKYYTGSRYPPMIEVSQEDAEEALGIAEKVRDFVLKKLNLLKDD
ncbi:MAG: DNA-binding protein [Thermofilum sp. ex4484_79]|nr:MAG: DNA-binding protein [Thermofilum sp. ex4484_79]